MRRIATSTLQPRPTRSQHDRCCGWQIRFESGGNSGGESRSRERSQPILLGATSKCSSWCAPLLSELCGLPSRLFAVFATVAAAHTCRSAVTSAGAACGERWPKASGETHSLLVSPAALGLRVRRPSVMALPLGLSPAVRYQSRTPLAVTTIVIICVASPSAICSQDQRTCNTTDVAMANQFRKRWQQRWRKQVA